MRVFVRPSLGLKEILRLPPSIEVGAVPVLKLLRGRGRLCRGWLLAGGVFLRVVAGCARQGFADDAVAVLVKAVRVFVRPSLGLKEVLRLPPSIEVRAVPVLKLLRGRGRLCRGRLLAGGVFLRVIAGCARQGFADGAVAVLVEAVGVFVWPSLGLKEILSLPPSIEVGAVPVLKLLSGWGGLRRGRLLLLMGIPP